MAEISKLKQGTTVYDIKDASAVHTVDSVLSSSSTNPVQNKVINAALNKKPTLLSLGPYTATLADSMYAFTLSAADITLLATAHDGVMVSFSSSSAFMPGNSISAFTNGTTVFNGVNCKGYSGTYSSATMLTSNTFVMILPISGSTGTGYIVEGTDDFSSLDATISGLSASKTITSLFETDGVISGVASDIAIAGSQVTSGTIAEARLPYSYVKKTGDTMTGDLVVPAERIANTYYGISFGRTTSKPVETILYTGILWVGGSHMPVIHITGYAYGLQSPVEFKIGFYIYNGKIGYCGATNMGSWNPSIYLFKYTRNSANYVAVGLSGSCYFLQLQADVQDEMGKFANIVTDSSAWSWSFLTTAGTIPAVDDGTTCISVPYKADILEGKHQMYGTCDTAAATAAKLVTCPGFVLVAGARIRVEFTNGSVSSSTTLNVNNTGAKSCSRIINGSSLGVAIRCNANDILEFIYNGTQYVVLTPYALRNNFTNGSRPTSANRSYSDAGLEYFLATSSMTTGKPPVDAAILNMNWDNSNVYGTQMAVSHDAYARVFTRSQNGSTAWGDWKELPRLISTPSDGQIIVADEVGNGMLKGVNSLEVNKISGSATHSAELENGDYLVFADQSNGGRLKTWTSGLIDTSDASKYLRHDGTWAEVGSSGSSIEDKAVYLSRVTNFGDHKYQFPSLIGGTVAWNQLVKNGNFADTSNWQGQYGTISAANNKLTYTRTSINGSARIQQSNIGFLKDHKYIIHCALTSSIATAAKISINTSPIQQIADFSLVANTKKDTFYVFMPTADASILYLYNDINAAGSIGDTVIYENVWSVDLTLVFGPTIADYIYSLETATTGAGVNWFKRYFPKSYYPPNAGALVSVNPTGVETVSRNLLINGEFIVGGRWSTTGVWEAATASNAGFNAKIPALPNTEYYFYMPNVVTGTNIYFTEFDADGNQISKSAVQSISTATKYRTWTSGSNTYYFGLSFYITSGSLNRSYFADACFNISDSLNGTYTPPSYHTYPISPVELRGILKLDSSNNLYYDGDKRYADGRVERKYVTVDLGTLLYDASSTNVSGKNRFISRTAIGAPTASSVIANVVCTKYVAKTGDALYMNETGITITSAGKVAIYDETYASGTASAFATAMNGVYALIELATPTTEQAAPFVTPYALMDGGMQRVIDDRDVPMPVYQESTISDVQNATKEMLDEGDIITRAEEFGPFYVEGEGSIAAVTASPYYASRWMGTNYSVKSLYSGLTINYKIDVAGNSPYGTILDVNGFGPHPVCANVNTMVSTRYAVGCIINLIYDAKQTATAYVNGTNTTFTGVWKIADYDSTIVYRLCQYFTRPLVNTNAGTVYGRQFILSKPDLSVIPVNNVNGGTGTYNKTLTTQSFDPFGPIYYFYYTGNSSYAPNNALPAGYLYRVLLADSRYSFNINSGGTAGTTALTANAPVYIKALYNDATKQATLAPITSSTNYLELSSLTQSLPSANPNGSLSAGQRYIYIYLGHAYDKYQIEVSASHQVYTWNKASSQMEEFTGAPLTHSSSFTFSNGQHSIIANYYKCGKQVTIYGDFGTTFISDTSSTFSLPFTPAQTSSVSLTGATTTTMVQLLGTISSTGLSLSAAWYQSSMGNSVSATISPMYYTQYVKDFQFSYITND